MNEATLKTLEAKVAEVLWDSMKRDPDHKDRVQTGWGTKTKEGLARVIHRIVHEADEDTAPSLISALEGMLEAYAPKAEESVQQSELGEDVLHSSVRNARAAIRYATKARP